MTAYCVGRICVKDAAAWEAYRGRVGATIAQYGGEVLFRGALDSAFGGRQDQTQDHDRVVALRFENVDAAKRWHESPEYQALISIREQGAGMELILYRD